MSDNRQPCKFFTIESPGTTVTFLSDLVVRLARDARAPLYNTVYSSLVQPIDILYTLDSASNYSTIQKLKP